MGMGCVKSSHATMRRGMDKINGVTNIYSCILLYLSFSWKEKKDMFAKDLFLRSTKGWKKVSIVEIKEKQMCYGICTLSIDVSKN